MNNREYVRGAFEEIHAPDALIRKVINMSKKEAKKNFKLKYAVVALAAFAVAFAGSNGICYAATGETWVGKAIVYINGEKQEADIEWSQEGDTLVGEVSYEIEEGDVVEVIEVENADSDIVVEDVELEFFDDPSSESGVGGTANLTYSYGNNVELVEENGKIYLTSYNDKVDITEDFADGKATGTIQFDGATANFTVTGTVEEYDISLTN